MSLIGKKIGMTRLFNADGIVTPVSVMEVGPCCVIEKKTKEKHGYESLVLGFEDVKKLVKLNKPRKGFFEKKEIVPKKHIIEFRVDEQEMSKYELTQDIKVDFFQKGDRVDVFGKTKGRGFQGVVKRHGHHRGPMSHGSHFHRRPGSIGACSSPSRVFKGKKLPGRMGNTQSVSQNLIIVRVDADKNLLFVKGAVPGGVNNLLMIKRTVKSS